MSSNRPVGYGRPQSSSSGPFGLNGPRAAALGLFAVASLLFLPSCGGGDVEVPVHPVTGTVKYGAEIPAGAKIVLHPQQPIPGDAVPTGKVGSDGTFQISTYGSGDGAPAGEYKATVQWFKIVGGEGGTSPGPNVLPKQYADAKASPITVSVKEGANEVPPIEIKR